MVDGPAYNNGGPGGKNNISGLEPAANNFGLFCVFRELLQVKGFLFLPG